MVTFVHKKSPLSHAWLSLVSLPPLSHVAEELPILHESGAVDMKYTVVTKLMITGVHAEIFCGVGVASHIEHNTLDTDNTFWITVMDLIYVQVNVPPSLLSPVEVFPPSLAVF